MPGMTISGGWTAPDLKSYSATKSGRSVAQLASAAQAIAITKRIRIGRSSRLLCAGALATKGHLKKPSVVLQFGPAVLGRAFAVAADAIQGIGEARRLTNARL